MSGSNSNYVFSVLVRADTKEMRQALKQTDDELRKFGKTAEAVSSYVNSWATKAQRAVLACAGLQAVASTFSGTLKGLMNSFAGFGEQLSSAALRSGISAASLSKLKYAAEQCGTSFETALDAVKTFQEQLGAASLGDTGAQDKLKAAGVDWSEYLPLNEEDQFLKLAQHIASITVPAEQARAAIELFGDAGYQLLPFFQKGEAGIRELCAEAEKLGLAFGGDDAEQAKALSQQLSALTAAASAAGRSIMAALAPALEGVLEIGKQLTSWAAGFMRQHPQIIKILGASTAAFIGLSVAIGGAAAAWTFFAAITPVGWFSLGISAVVAFVAALGTVETGEKKLQQEIEKTNAHLKEQMTQLEKERGIVHELSQLAKKTSLTNEERKRSLALIERLQKAYPGLRLEIDKTSGRVQDLAAAYEQVLTKERQIQIDALEKKLAAGEARWQVLAGHRGKLRERIAQREENDRIRKQLDDLREGSAPGVIRRAAVRQAYDAAFVDDVIAKQSDIQPSQAETAYEKQRRELRDEYDADYDALIAAARQLRLLKKEGIITADEVQQLERVEKLMEDRNRRYRADVEKLNLGQEQEATRKKTEAIEKAAAKRKEQLETEKQIYALRDKMLRLEKSSSAAELERLRKENRDLLAKLGVDPNSDDPRAIAAGAAEYAFIGNALGDTTAALRKDPVEEAQWRLTQAKLQGNHDSVALAEKNLKQVQEQAQKNSIRGLKQEVSEAELRAKETRQAWEEGRLRADLSPEEKLKLGDAAVAADRDLRQKRARLTTLADERYQAPELRQPKDLITSARGTFSAFGIDAALGADVPKQTLDYIKKLSGIIAAWYDLVQREGKLPTSVQLL